MKKQALFMVVFLAAVGLLAGVAASNAFAYAGGYTVPCVAVTSPAVPLRRSHS